MDDRIRASPPAQREEWLNAAYFLNSAAARSPSGRFGAALDAADETFQN
jgi:hypothetical protein